jgi:hypothetical protein
MLGSTCHWPPQIVTKPQTFREHFAIACVATTRLLCLFASQRASSYTTYHCQLIYSLSEQTVYSTFVICSLFITTNYTWRGVQQMHAHTAECMQLHNDGCACQQPARLAFLATAVPDSKNLNNADRLRVTANDRQTALHGWMETEMFRRYYFRQYSV